MAKKVGTDELCSRARDMRPRNVNRRNLREAFPLQGLEIDDLRGRRRSDEGDEPGLFFHLGFLLLLLQI